MGRLRHRTAPRCTYFITTDAWQKRAIFHVSELAEIVCQRIVACRDRGAYSLHEFVVMPDHLHLLITPSENTTLEKAIQLIKGGSSHQIHQRRGHRMRIWQSGFHEWSIRDAADYRAKAGYIRMNPVTAHLSERPEEWAYSSASGRFVLDSAPDIFRASGAKAPEEAKLENVGAEAPTP
jgi:putative transposase